MSKVVLITGSSTGIGQHTAMELAKRGHSLVITYCKHKDEGLKTYNRCLDLGMQQGLCLFLDLMDNQSIEDCIEETVKVFGGIDVLINNAGVLAWKPLLKQSISEIEAQIRVNLEGAVKMTRLALPYLREMVINIASGAGKYAFSELTTYCATKFGLRGFTQALAKELPRLKVYSVNPGMTATAMTNFQGVHPSKVARTVADIAEGRYDLPSGSDIDL